jgi:hypothetical protein
VDAVNDPLRELWDATVIPVPSAYTTQTVALGFNDSAGVAQTAQMPCGWRGPYVQTPIFRQATSNGAAQPQIVLLDGWGNPLEALNQTTAPSYSLTPAAVGQPINLVRSRGADGLIDVMPLQLPYPPYNQDGYAPVQNYQVSGNTATLPSPLASLAYAVEAAVPVNVQMFNTSTGALGDPAAIGANDAVRVLLFRPVNGVLAAISSGDTTLPPGSPGAPTPVSVTFAGVPIGPRAIQAFLLDKGPSTPVIRKRSPMVQLMVPAGGVATQTLVLQ